MDHQTLTHAKPSSTRDSHIKLLVVLGEGGHTKQMLNLVALLQSIDQADNYQLSYIVAKEDPLSAGHIKCPGLIYRVNRPRGKSTGRIGAAFRTILAGIQSLRILLQVRPDAIISAGPAIAVPVSIIGKVLGTRIIYVESSSRIRHVSLTGRIMYRWADLFFVQWQQLQEKLPEAIFAGRLV
jgi:beta-1,4-N-acetylglucosaminyltransferase